MTDSMNAPFACTLHFLPTLSTNERKRVLHSTHVPVRRYVVGLQLIFDDPPGGAGAISLWVGSIWVSGRLRVGGEGCRIKGRLTITFQPASGKCRH